MAAVPSKTSTREVNDITKKSLALSISKLSFEASEDRTNWMTFKGTCMYVDKPSDYVPSNGDKPTMFPKDETEKALPSFVNMGVNCRYNSWYSDALFEGHDSQFKVGVVTSATIEGDEVIITGGLWSWDFAELCDKVKSAKESLGWSIEVIMYLTQGDGDYYVARDIEFVGVALMWADKAAFADTYMFAQRKNKKKEGIPMEKQELQAMLAEFTAGINKAINDNIEGVKAEFAAQIDVVAKNVTEFQATYAASEEARTAKEAEKAAVEAEATRLALEAKAAEEAQRKSMVFGVQPKRFEGEDDAQKAVMDDVTLSPGEKFRRIIDLKLQAK